MARLFPILLCSLALVALGPAHASDKDDGFVWVDANTKIRIKPIGKPGTAATGGTAAPAPAPKKEEKEKTRK